MQQLGGMTGHEALSIVEALCFGLHPPTRVPKQSCVVHPDIQASFIWYSSTGKLRALQSPHACRPSLHMATLRVLAVRHLIRRCYCQGKHFPWN